MTVHQLLNTMMSQRQKRRSNQYTDGFILHHAIWEQLSPTTRNEVQHIHDLMLTSVSGGSIPSTSSTSNYDMASTLIAVGKANRTKSAPKQYSNPAECSIHATTQHSRQLGSVAPELVEPFKEVHEEINTPSY